MSSDSESEETDEGELDEQYLISVSTAIQKTPVNLCKRSQDQLSPSSAEKKREKKKRKQKEKLDEKESHILSCQGLVPSRRGRSAKNNP